LLNPRDGSLISLVSRPNFDPNIFLDPISPVAWQSLQQSNPFLNRALDASYPSGSIFKLITISAALENNIIDADSLWNCKGYTLFGKRKYWCARRSGHGEVSMTQAVAESCNTLFFEIGKKIDIDLLAEYAHKFGLGQKTNSILPEKSGLVPNREWKMDCKGERWWPGETLSVAIGQSFLLVTPMQIARMIGAIFTGYLVSSRLLIDEPVITFPLDIQPETINFLKKSMKMVVRQGTGRSVRKIKDIKIYAKTSTAQTSDYAKRKLDEKYLEHGWFVCYFQYKDHEPLVMVIVVERVGAAQVVTTIAKDFFVEYKKYMDALYS
jgi:penicillin-binding protein 2